MVARTVLVLLALIYVVRFAVPAFIGAAASVFGEPWLADPLAATVLLDSDIRFFGVMSATLATVLLVLSFDVRRHLLTLDLIMVGVLIGGVVRLAEILVGDLALPLPAQIATGVELVFPAVWFVAAKGLRPRVHLERSIEVDRPKAAMWTVFAEFGGVDEWHPYMEKAALDEGSPRDGVGASRTCEFGPNMAIRETVVEWDDAGSMTIAIEFLRGLAPPICDIRASVRVEPLADGRSRLVLSMSFQPRLGALGGLMAELFVRPLYASVFAHMLRAAKARAETGDTLEPIAMPLSGRRLAAS